MCIIMLHVELRGIALVNINLAFGRQLMHGGTRYELALVNFEAPYHWWSHAHDATCDGSNMVLIAHFCIECWKHATVAFSMIIDHCHRPEAILPEAPSGDNPPCTWTSWS